MDSSSWGSSSFRSSDIGRKPLTRIKYKKGDHLLCKAQPCIAKHATTMNRKL